MEGITSFTVNHLNLEPDVHVSRKNTTDPETVTTFDFHMTTSNKEPVVNTTEVHTLKHLGAISLRNHAGFGARVLYFGPMGCHTGFYLLLRGGYGPVDILPLLHEPSRFVMNFMGEVPGAAARNCGNYLDMNLLMAGWGARRYLEYALSAPWLSRLRCPDQEKLKL